MLRSLKTLTVEIVSLQESSYILIVLVSKLKWGKWESMKMYTKELSRRRHPPASGRKTQEYEKMSEEGNCESRIKCLVKQKTYKTVQSHLPQCLLFIDINNSLFYILKPTSFSNASILNLNYQLWWEIFGFNLWWIVLSRF